MKLTGRWSTVALALLWLLALGARCSICECKSQREHGGGRPGPAPAAGAPLVAPKAAARERAPARGGRSAAERFIDIGLDPVHALGKGCERCGVAERIDDRVAADPLEQRAIFIGSRGVGIAELCEPGESAELRGDRVEHGVDGVELLSVHAAGVELVAEAPAGEHFEAAIARDGAERLRRDDPFEQAACGDGEALRRARRRGAALGELQANGATVLETGARLASVRIGGRGFFGWWLGHASLSEGAPAAASSLTVRIGLSRRSVSQVGVFQSDSGVQC